MALVVGTRTGRVVGRRKARIETEAEKRTEKRTGIAAAAGTKTEIRTKIEKGIGTGETAIDLAMMTERGRSQSGQGAAGPEKSRGAKTLGSADQAEGPLHDLDAGGGSLTLRP